MMPRPSATASVRAATLAFSVALCGVATAAPTWTPGKPALKAAAHCSWGPPARLEGRLVVPKACRIPVGKKAVVRHSVEIRDIVTGKRLAQASLPAVPAGGEEPPDAGAILDGPYPLYVHAGGVAAVAVRARRMETVHEAEGALVGLARHDEVLSVVERVPAGKGNAATVWTLLDFGRGQELGTARLAAGDVAAVGFAPRGKGLDATLVLARKGRATTFSHTLRDGKGVPSAASATFAPTARPTPAAKGAASRPCRAKPARSCPTFGDPALRVLPPHPEIRISASGCVTGAAAGKPLPLAAPQICAGALAPRGVDPGWAWLRKDVRGEPTWVLAPLSLSK